MSVISSSLPIAEEIVGPTPGQRLRRRIFGHRGIIIGGGILGIIVLLALLAPLLAPYDPYAQISDRPDQAAGLVRPRQLGTYPGYRPAWPRLS